jgi:ribosome-associated translation inhibitor RaiA
LLDNLCEKFRSIHYKNVYKVETKTLPRLNFSLKQKVMNYTENYRGIKIDVQAVNQEINDVVQAEVRACIDKMLRFTPEINAVDAYFKIEGKGQDITRIVGIRIGIPGPDVFAEDKGDRWVPLLKSVTEKLIKQFQKSKV